MTGHHIYYFNYMDFEKELCRLEIRSVFNVITDNKYCFSDLCISPSISPFIKGRIDVMIQSPDYKDLLDSITEAGISVEDFKVSYIDITSSKRCDIDKRGVCRDIGLRIEGFPCYDNPRVSYAVTYNEGIWYFGYIIKNSNDWKRHKTKPHSYSSSIGLSTAKALVNIASRGNVNTRIIDPCCGVGTVLIEGIYNGLSIVGNDINDKIVKSAEANLDYFDYETDITNKDIVELDGIYDAAILDIPYGNFCKTSLESQIKIISNAKRLADRVVLISSKDMSDVVHDLGLSISDTCKVGKGGDPDRFIRYVWVCH